MRKIRWLFSGLVLSFPSILYANVNVDFWCENGNTVSEVSSAYVVGSHPKLGSWNVNNAVLLSADEYPTWKGTVFDLPRDTKIEWKCIRRLENCSPKCGKNDVDWQPPPGSAGNNRFITPADGGIEAQKGGWPDGTAQWPTQESSVDNILKQPKSSGGEFEVVDINKILKELPTGKRWITHLRQDLLPFWTNSAALGKQGNFPTYRCNNGSLFNPKKPCPELENANTCCHCKDDDCPSFCGDGYKEKVGCLVDFSKEYVRAKARQAYAYGVAYHLTGDPRYLDYAKEGVDFLIKNALDRENGGAYSYWHIQDKSTEPGPAVLQRTSQDMAYAVSGLGFYYYLTRDEEVLEHVVALKDYIFKTYYNKSLDLMMWVRENSPDGVDTTDRKELVSQLDQIYGYMIWLTPVLPEPLQSAWKKDLVHLAQIMIEQFYSEKYGLFWGAISDSETKNLGTSHTDFGHSIKTLWLIYQIGKMTGHLDLVTFAQVRAINLLDKAYIEETGSWGIGYQKTPDGKDWILNKDKEWWSFAELDQTTATLSLVNPSFAAKLVKTYQYWFDHLVDHDHKLRGMWHIVKAVDNKPDLDFPKQHSWKNAFHSFEHALVSYITSQQLHNLPVELYYAFEKKPSEALIHPYVYFGKIHRIEKYSVAMKNYKYTISDSQTWKITFTDIR